MRHHRLVLAPCRWLVGPITHDNRPGLAGAAHGRLASQARKPGDSAFRSGLAVRKPGMADVPAPAQPRTQHEPAWELPRQRGCRKLLSATEARADQTPDISNPSRCEAGRLRIHRTVLQPETQAHEQRHAVARRLRNQTAQNQPGRCLGN